MKKINQNILFWGNNFHFFLLPKHMSDSYCGKNNLFSLEFCGGPHVEHTGVLGMLKIQKEESVSAGVRRIKAILG